MPEHPFREENKKVKQNPPLRLGRAQYLGDRLVTVADVQTITSLSARKIFAMAATGELERVKIGRATRFRLSDVNRLLVEGAPA